MDNQADNLKESVDLSLIDFAASIFPGARSLTKDEQDIIEENKKAVEGGKILMSEIEMDTMEADKILEFIQHKQESMAKEIRYNLVLVGKCLAKVSEYFDKELSK